MANTTLLISEAYLKTTPISASIDYSMLVPHIEQTQLIWQREILGRELYDDIITKYAAQTLSTDEQALVALMKPAIAYRTCYDALPFLSIQIKPKGAVKINGENEQPVTLNEMKYMQTAYENKAQYHEERLIEYLCLNGHLFPLYGKADTKTGVNAIQTQAFESDIYLGDAEADVKNNRRFFNF